METGKNKKGKNRILFWMLAILAIIFVVTSINSGAIIFFINLILWVGFILFLKRQISAKTYSFNITVAFSIIIVIISFLTISGGSKSKTSNGKDLSSYVGKAYKLTSSDGKIQGTAGITEVTESKKGKQYIGVQFNIKVKDNLPANGKCPTRPGGCGKGEYHYDYANNLVEPNEKYNETGEGQLSNIQCNEEAMPEDPMDFGFATYQCPLDARNVIKKPSKYFLADFTKKYLSIEDFLSVSKFEIYDGSNFWEIEEEKTIGEGITTTTGSIDTDRAVSEGEKIREYEFKITEVK